MVTARVAHAGMWCDPWELVHPLLYARTLGRKEEAVLAAGFHRVSIFQPGMLDRLKVTGCLSGGRESGRRGRAAGRVRLASVGQPAASRSSPPNPPAVAAPQGDRWHESAINWLGFGLRVDVLASAMVRDAESERPLATAPLEAPVYYSGNSAIAALLEPRP